MIKKIEDITLMEFVKICENKSCEHCPLYDFCLKKYKKYPERVFNREIELPDNLLSHKNDYLPGSSLPNNFNIICDNVCLYQKNIDLDIRIPAYKFENIDTIVINGIKYKKM